MSDEDIVAMLLGLQSWTDVTVELHGDTVRAAGTTGFWAQPLRPVAVLVPHLPERVTRLELTVHTSTEQRLLAGPTEPWRRYSASADWDKQLHFVECCRRWHLDGKPTFDQDQIRLWAARQALVQAATGYPACVRRLRQLRDFAQRLQDDELANDLRELIAYVRDASTGLADQATGSNIVSRFTHWAQANVAVPAVL